ncbi:hypothetical protein K504DRAFT_457607 [Pleomassaria siparia CBS 279.74]|uniref:CFEM domain-containing protein n=1 Tax=Pleomassaria siparia CBS 279.74 TaxID=1314801 RepID=A0A6G1KSS4_9PLEO|nr:hypothetical protein K504DRAFT_457607 [Pleomassaria siparia CBS 279.74]
MKYATITLSALIALTTAQTIADLPSCSLSCVVDGVSATGCSTTDFACSCGKADVLTPSITPCVKSACSEDDQAKVITALEGICAAAGVPISIPDPTSTAPAPESTSAVEEPVPTSSVAPTNQASAPVPSYTDIVLSSALPLRTDPCAIVTVTVTETSGQLSIAPVPTASYPTVPAGNGTVTETSGQLSIAPVPTAPYPTVSAGNGTVPEPSGTGAHSSSLPEFTAAAVTVKIPAGIVGALSMIAYLL